MFKKSETKELENDCISSCISGSTCSSENIGHQIGSICYEVIKNKKNE